LNMAQRHHIGTNSGASLTPISLRALFFQHQKSMNSDIERWRAKKGGP
jgi:hypothetical protein